MRSTELITICNRGFIKFVKNLNESLRNIESDQDLLVYCLDSETLEILENNNIRCKLLETKKNNPISSDMVSFLVEESRNIYMQQFEAITEALKTNDNVIWIDADCVVLNNKLFNELEEMVENKELLYLSDGGTPTRKYASSGLMYIKSNENTRNLFSPEEVEEYIDEGAAKYFRPQRYLNSIIRSSLNADMIPYNLCRSQKYFRKDISEDLYLVHYNWSTPVNKEKLMVKNRHWYIPKTRVRR